MRRVLVIEDDRELLEGLTINLEGADYEVLGARNGEDGLEMAARHRPDAVILDLMMPKIGGFDVCRALRKRGFDAPILILTARGREADKVKGLGLGADDYITKPFSIRELLARLAAVIRRSSPKGGQEREVYEFGNVRVDFGSQQLRRGDKTMVLSYLECEVLQYLIGHRGQVVSRDDLLASIWGYDNTLTTRAVDNLVARLRGKVEDDPHQPRCILSVYGVGYRFVG